MDGSRGKGIVVLTDFDFIPLLLCSSIVDLSQIFTAVYLNHTILIRKNFRSWECTGCNAGHTGWNSHTTYVFVEKRLLTNFNGTIWDRI